MQTVRTLLISSAVGLLAADGAQAADLPVKAKRVEFVRICSLYGAGFFFIPGSDTCIKLGGYVRADVTLNGGGAHGQPAWSSDPGQQNRFRDYFIDRSRLVMASKLRGIRSNLPLRRATGPHHRHHTDNDEEQRPPLRQQLFQFSRGRNTEIDEEQYNAEQDQDRRADMQAHICLPGLTQIGTD